VGDGQPPYRNFFKPQKKISVPPNLEKKEGLFLWNVGETPGDENASAMRDGILRKYSRRKRIDEPGSPVPKGGVVHSESMASLPIWEARKS